MATRGLHEQGIRRGTCGWITSFQRRKTFGFKPKFGLELESTFRFYRREGEAEHLKFQSRGNPKELVKLKNTYFKNKCFFGMWAYLDLNQGPHHYQ